MATVVLAIDEVGLAVRLQTALEAAGHQVSWSAPRPGVSASPSLDADLIVLLHRADLPLAQRVQEIKRAEPPPAVLIVGETPGAEQEALGQRVQYIESRAESRDIVNAVAKSLELRYCNEITFETAMGALGLRMTDRGQGDHQRILQAARQADPNIVRQALNWHVYDYAFLTRGLEDLREQRALAIPEIEFAQGLLGTRTVKTVVQQSKLGAIDAARALWALVAIGLVRLSSEPPARMSQDCRAIYEARRHLAHRVGQLKLATYYDLLELAPTGSQEEADAAFHQLQARFSQAVIGKLDLGQLSAMVGPTWHAVVEAHTALRDPRQRPYYNQTLVRRTDVPPLSWARTRNYEAAVLAFAQGQQSLVRGDVFAAVSSMATAARNHPGHPVYEASLAWARFRAEATRGGDRVKIAETEREVAENALLGRRPWPQALVALGLLCVAAGDADSARWNLHLALAIEPRLPMAQQLLARLNSGG